MPVLTGDENLRPQMNRGEAERKIATMYQRRARSKARSDQSAIDAAINESRDSRMAKHAKERRLHFVNTCGRIFAEP